MNKKKEKEEKRKTYEDYHTLDPIRDIFKILLISAGMIAVVSLINLF